MLSTQDIRSVTELRTQTSRLLEEVKRRQTPIYILSRSKLQAVLASVDLWNKIAQVKEERIVGKDPFVEVRKKYGYPFAGLDVVATIRKTRDERCI